MLSRLFSRSKRPFLSLSEQEILALAISSEEDDGRIYLAYADALRGKYPHSARVFEDMAEEESHHRQALIDLHVSRFGNRIALIRREHVFVLQSDTIKGNMQELTVTVPDLVDDQPPAVDLQQGQIVGIARAGKFIDHLHAGDIACHDFVL